MSHFSTIKTQLKEVEPLLKALNHSVIVLIKKKSL